MTHNIKVGAERLEELFAVALLERDRPVAFIHDRQVGTARLVIDRMDNGYRCSAVDDGPLSDQFPILPRGTHSGSGT